MGTTQLTDIIFGVNLSSSAGPGADPIADALEAERLGFDFVSANDHPNDATPTHELWTLLAWVAAKTSRIKVASRVIGVPYRNPAMLAKMAVTLSEFAGGRLILGLGGGSSDEGMAAFGIEAVTPRAKIDGLEDALRIVRGLWSESGFTYRGAIHSVFGANLEPKPRRPIPIWLGTFGHRGLAVAGRFANGWIPSHGMAPPEQAREMRERVLDAARAAGRDPEEIRCVYNVEVGLGERNPDPSIVSGSIEEVTDRFLGFVELGFTGFNLIPVGPDPEVVREQLAQEVLPQLRSSRRKAPEAVRSNPHRVEWPHEDQDRSWHHRVMGHDHDLALASLEETHRMFVENVRRISLDEALDAAGGYRSILGLAKHVAAWSAVYHSYAFEENPRHWDETDWPRALRDRIEPTMEYLGEILAWFDATYERWLASVRDVDDLDAQRPVHWGGTAPLVDILAMVTAHWAYHAGEINMILAIRRGEAWEYTEEVEENHISTAGHGVRPSWMTDEEAAAFEREHQPSQ